MRSVAAPAPYEPANCRKVLSTYALRTRFREPGSRTASAYLRIAEYLDVFVRRRHPCRAREMPPKRPPYKDGGLRVRGRSPPVRG